MSKYRIHQNQYGNWYGYKGSKKIEQFFNSSEQTQEESAKKWLKEKELEIAQNVRLAMFCQIKASADQSLAFSEILDENGNWVFLSKT